MGYNSVQFKNRAFLIGIAFTIVLAILLGSKRDKIKNHDLISSSIKDLNIEARYVNPNKWEVYEPSTGLIAGFIYTGEGKGYNGPIKSLIISDTNNIIRSVQILSQSETHSYFQQIDKKNFLNKLKGIDLGSINTVDGVSGATKSSMGIINGIASAYSKGGNLHLSKDTNIHFGFLEIFILVLFALAVANTKIRNKKYVKLVWWLSLLLSILFLGFIYNQPITIARINSLLLGFWPPIYSELFVYFIVLGAILSILFTGKNFYCHSVCPFGATQELIGKLGNAKPRKPKYWKILKKIQWAFTFFAVIIALLTYNPGISEYEIYGGLFKLTATIAGFILLILIVFASLFIKRPWCNYLCPLDGVFKYFSMVRKEL